MRKTAILWAKKVNLGNSMNFVAQSEREVVRIYGTRDLSRFILEIHQLFQVDRSTCPFFVA